MMYNEANEPEEAVNALEKYLDTAEMALWNLTHRLGVAEIADILIVAVIIYQLIMLMRQTRGSAVLKGLVLLLLAAAVSTLLGLTALNWLVMILIRNGVVVLIILFQPELRKVLESLGRGTRIGQSRNGEPEDERARIIGEIVHCMTNLSRRRVGALIVFERNTGLKDIIETGTAVDSRISSPLLENIFEPNTPLHDGAVIIRDDRVVAAACILPLTDNQRVSQELGTRHRASLGISEATDAIALIVSEETGVMSCAEDGHLQRHLDAASLRRILEGIYEKPAITLRSLIFGRKGAAAK